MITLICGLPRAGKTTYSERFDNVIHLDTSGGYNGVLQRLKRKHGDIIVEGVYRFYRQRENLIRAYNGTGYKCIWLDTPDDIRKSRRGWHKYCDIPPFEPPTLSEGWDEIIIIRGDHEQRINRKG